MSRVCVMFLVDSINDEAGGAERFVAGLAAALDHDRYEVIVTTTRDGGGRLIAELERSGVRHIAAARRFRADVFGLWRVFRAIRDERVDVLHANKFGSNLWGAIFGRLLRVPVIVAEEHTWAYSGQRLRPLLDGRVIGPLSDAFVAVSTADRDRMISLEGVDPAKVEVIPTAYIPRAGGDGDDVRHDLGLAPDTPLVGTIAILRPQKALHILIEAFALIAAANEAPHLVIAGTGESEADLRRQAAALPCSQRIHFLGLRQDVNAIWRSIDVGALSSDFEGTPIAALEAMFNGAPLVATAVGGVPDLIEDGVSGLLVPARDPRALADGISRLLADQALRASMAEAARGRLEDHSLERLVARTQALYERLLARPGRRAARGREGRPVTDVLVLSLHAVSETWPADLSIKPTTLERQLAELVRRGYRGSTLHEAIHEPAPGKKLVITFDDAYRSVIELGFPILERLGLRGTVFVPTDHAGTGRPMVWPGIDRWLGGPHERELLPMNWDELRRLDAAGWEIGSHTCSHPWLTTVTDDELQRELRESRERCTAEIGKPCRSLAYPYGGHDDRVVAATRSAGYTAACTVPELLRVPDALRYPRIGLYNNETDLSFRAKVSPAVRMLRRSFLAPPAVAAMRRARRLIRR